MIYFNEDLFGETSTVLSGPVINIKIWITMLQIDSKSLNPLAHFPSGSANEIFYKANGKYETSNSLIAPYFEYHYKPRYSMTPFGIWIFIWNTTHISNYVKYVGYIAFRFGWVIGIYPDISELCHWPWDNYAIATIPVKRLCRMKKNINSRRIPDSE